jgi:outer membrane protein OmpA-like peptidoglycan-associated protein
MILIGKKQKYTWARNDRTRPETFWASYSDLMAGLLMVFALTTVITLLDIGMRLVEPTQVVKEWEKVLDEICHDPDLAKMENVKIDCNTGALIISDENLRFGFAETALGQEAEEVLRKAVPKYMEVIFRYPEFLNLIEVIEISGHTDRMDAGGANPYFSRKRAGQVLEFLLGEPAMTPYKNILKSKAISSGYSDTRFPSECIDDECAAARRVEIAIHLNDREVLKEFLRILKQIIGEE